MTVKVWFTGDGNNELGSFVDSGTRGRGVLEALLAHVSPTGWRCIGKTPWHTIQKFQAGGAHLRRSNHGDYLNVLGLVLRAYEQASDAAVFVRDIDSDPEREDAVLEALDWLRKSDWMIAVIGGVAKPALEGWILALRALPGTDAMSRARATEHLLDREIPLKSTEHFLDVVDQATLGDPPHFGLPTGTESLRSWLATAHDVMNRLIHGATPGPR